MAKAAAPKKGPRVNAPSPAATDDMPWMDWMRQHRNEIQQTGAKPTQFTIDIFKHTSYPPLQGYTPESCAATVCAALEETGYKSTHSAAAVSYRNYGTACDLTPGCIVVFQWPDGSHHVDFCDQIIDSDTMVGLGGNQGHELQDSQFARRFIIATRWPVSASNAASTGSAGAGGAGAMRRGGAAAFVESNGSAPRTPRPFDVRAAARYGQFIQATYSMYSQYVTSPNSLTPPVTSDFPVEYQLVAWIHMQDFVLNSTAPAFYGIVAQSTMDANQFVVAIRGTSNGVEWWDNVNAALKTSFKVPGCGSVGYGFARIYDTLEVVPCSNLALPPAPSQSLRPSGGFAEQVTALVRQRGPARAGLGAFSRGASVEITGHSLGGALATLYAMENAHTDQIDNPALCTFASPLVGDAAFAAAFNGLGLTSWRVINAPDLVPRLPPEILGFVHVDTAIPVNSSGKVMPLVTCWHALATYLSLIDPTKQPDAGCRLAPALGAPKAGGFV